MELIVSVTALVALCCLPEPEVARERASAGSAERSIRTRIALLRSLDLHRG